MTTTRRPMKIRKSVVFEGLYALTVNALDARILAQFIYWSDRVNDYDQLLEEESRRATRSGHPFNVTFSHGWIYKKVTELIEEIMADESESTVRRRLQHLVAMGWLAERRNPNHAWDKTLQYRVDTIAIIEDLAFLGYHLEGYVLLDEVSNLHHEASKNRHASPIPYREGAIPNITTDTTTQTLPTDTTTNVTALTTSADAESGVLPDSVAQLPLMGEATPTTLPITEKSRKKKATTPPPTPPAQKTTKAAKPAKPPKEKKPAAPRRRTSVLTEEQSAYRTEMIDVYSKALDYEIPRTEGGRMGKAANQLVLMGYTIEQVMGCYHSIKAEKYWRTRFLRLETVLSEIGEWVKRHPTTPAAATTDDKEAYYLQMVEANPNVDPAVIRKRLNLPPLTQLENA